jgi:hypothetical protein
MSWRRSVHRIDGTQVLSGFGPMHQGLTRLVPAAILAAIVLCGCATVAPVNVPVDRVGPDTGYRIAKLLVRDRGPANNPDALVLLAFSGGGMRAAALSYGVLEELRRTPIVVKGHQQSMLDEVDLIAGVSGGSFTALAYALYGERLFHEYQHRFLKRNVQAALIQRVLNPTSWPRLASDSYGRSELAADYYDEILFGGATFGDLIPLGAPVAVVTGTDLSTGARFEFSQDTFDLMCSDLGSVRLARAAATSSAVPVLLSPVTYRNYGGRCGAILPIWVRTLRTENTRPAPPDERCCGIVISRRSRTARTAPTCTSSMAGSRTTSDYVACSKRWSSWRRVRRSNARCASPNCAISSSSWSILARPLPPIGIEKPRRQVLCRS